MSMQDPVSDMLTRIRNAHHRSHPEVTMPASKLKASVAKVLQDEGYIASFSVSEEVKPDPITTYDLHKLFIEQHLEMATKNKIISATSLRLSNVYGPSLGRSSANDRGILNKVIESAINGKDITIYDEGNYMRDYIYIDDVVSAFINTAIADNTIGKVLNVTSGVGHTIKDAFSLVSDHVAKLTGKKVKINHIEWPKGISMIERRNFIGNADELKRITKWQPNTLFEEGIDIIVEGFWREKNC